MLSEVFKTENITMLAKKSEKALILHWFSDIYRKIPIYKVPAAGNKAHRTHFLMSAKICLPVLDETSHGSSLGP